MGQSSPFQVLLPLSSKQLTSQMLGSLGVLTFWLDLSGSDLYCLVLEPCGEHPGERRSLSTPLSS